MAEHYKSFVDMYICIIIIYPLVIYNLQLLSKNLQFFSQNILGILAWSVGISEWVCNVRLGPLLHHRGSGAWTFRLGIYYKGRYCITTFFFSSEATL